LRGWGAGLEEVLMVLGARSVASPPVARVEVALGKILEMGRSLLAKATDCEVVMGGTGLGADKLAEVAA
jgi:hypothetical protein